MLDFSVTFIITIINIVVLYFILKAILFKPVTKFMAQRAQRIQDSIAQAEREKTEAQKLLAQYQEKLKNSDAEAAEIIRAAEKEAKTEAEKIIAERKAEAENLIRAAHAQMESERQAMFARFKIEAAALVMAASARLLQREMSGDDNRRYAAMLLDELAAQKGNS